MHMPLRTLHPCWSVQWQQGHRQPLCSSRHSIRRTTIVAGQLASSTISVAPAQQVVSQQQASFQGQAAASQRPRAEAQVVIKRRAKAARLAGKPQDALQILQRGLEQYPDDIHLIAAAASAAAKLGDAATAFEILSPTLQEQPHNVHLLTATAAAHIADGSRPDARRCYQAAAAAQPDSVVVLTAWGCLEASCEDTAAAVSLFKQAAAADPQHAPVYGAWARLEASRGRVREARMLHQQGHKCDPAHAPNLHAWAELEAGEGHWLRAVKLLEQALAADQQHLPSWMALGKAHWALGDSAAARRVFQHACKSLGPRPELLTQWATLEQQSQRIAASRAVLAFLDDALQQQQQQQQQQDSEQQCEVQQQQQPSKRTSKQRQPQQQATSMEAAVPRQQPCSTSANISAAAAPLPAEGAAIDGEAEAVDSGGWSTSSAAGLSSELHQQLEELVNLLNSLGSASRLVAAHVPAPGQRIPPPSMQAQQRPQQPCQQPGLQQRQQPGLQQHRQQGTQEQQQLPSGPPATSTSVKGLQQYIPGAPALPIPPKGLQQHIPGLVSAAAMEHRAGNTARALKLYSVALQHAPSNPRLLHAVAQLQLKRGDRSAAEEHLKRLEAVDPGNGFLCYTRGLLAQEQGQLVEARSWFERGSKAPGSEPALLNYEALAQLYAFRRDAAAARSAIAAGLSCRRPTARFLRTAALVEKRLGDDSAAAQLLLRAVARAPRDYRSWLAWGVLERRRGDHAAAARCFQRGTACAPCNPHIWYAWAHMTWHDVSDYRAARRLYEQATTYCPRNAPLWMEWAMLEWDEARNIDRARQLFQAGADVPASYQHPPLYQAWAQREAAVGNAGQAQQLRHVSEEVAKTCRKALKQAGQ